MKQLTLQMCINYIQQLVTCENFAQVSFFIDHIPEPIKKRIAAIDHVHETHSANIVQSEGVEFWVKQKQLIEHRGSETEKELTEHLLKSEIRPGEAFIKVAIHDEKIVKQIRRYFRNEEAKEAEAWVRNKRR